MHMPLNHVLLAAEEVCRTSVSNPDQLQPVRLENLQLVQVNHKDNIVNAEANEDSSITLLKLQSGPAQHTAATQHLRDNVHSLSLLRQRIQAVLNVS